MTCGHEKEDEGASEPMDASTWIDPRAWHLRRVLPICCCHLSLFFQIFGRLARSLLVRSYMNVKVGGLCTVFAGWIKKGGDLLRSKSFPSCVYNCKYQWFHVCHSQVHQEFPWHVFRGVAALAFYDSKGSWESRRAVILARESNLAKPYELFRISWSVSTTSSMPPYRRLTKALKFYSWHHWNLRTDSQQRSFISKRIWVPKHASMSQSSAYIFLVLLTLLSLASTNTTNSTLILLSNMTLSQNITSP